MNVIQYFFKTYPKETFCYKLLSYSSNNNINNNSFVNFMLNQLNQHKYVTLQINNKSEFID